MDQVDSLQACLPTRSGVGRVRGQENTEVSLSGVKSDIWPQ